MRPTKEHTVVMDNMADSFRQFMRNGVWGTCVDCPRDVDGHAHPENCVHKTRDDHLLPPADLFEQYESRTASEFYRNAARQ